MRPIDLVIVHHTAGPQTTTVDAIRAFHTAPKPAGRGWSDVGYHYLVRKLGPDGPWTVEEGRPVSKVGAHDQGQNGGSVGIAIAGDYTRDPMPFEGWLVLVATVAAVCVRFGLSAEAVEVHRDNEPGPVTACPGFDADPLRSAVRLALRGPYPLAFAPPRTEGDRA